MLQVALERYIYLENNRVIDALTDTMTKGPHSKIKDPVCFTRTACDSDSLCEAI